MTVAGGVVSTTIVLAGGKRVRTMNKTALLVIIAAASVSFAAADAKAQRTFVERPGASIGVRRAGDWRAANSLNHLNREVREARLLAGRGAGRGTHYRLARIARATDRLNYEYHRRLARPWTIHRRAEALRSEVRAIRAGLRGRGWRWR